MPKCQQKVFGLCLIFVPTPLCLILLLFSLACSYLALSRLILLLLLSSLLSYLYDLICYSPSSKHCPECIKLFALKPYSKLTAFIFKQEILDPLFYIYTTTAKPIRKHYFFQSFFSCVLWWCGKNFDYALVAQKSFLFFCARQSRDWPIRMYVKCGSKKARCPWLSFCLGDEPTCAYVEIFYIDGHQKWRTKLSSQTLRKIMSLKKPYYLFLLTSAPLSIFLISM